LILSTYLFELQPMKEPGCLSFLFLLIGLFGLFKMAEFQFYNQPKWLNGEAVQYVLFDSTGIVSLRQGAAVGIYGKDNTGRIIPGYLGDLSRNNKDIPREVLRSKIEGDGFEVPVYYTWTNYTTIRPGNSKESIYKYTQGAKLFFFILTIPLLIIIVLIRLKKK